MNEFIHELGAEYILDDYKIKKDVVVFHISSKCEELVCPYCGEKSNKVHSTYEREIQDLPMQNKKVILLVKTRKMFCHNSLCSKKTFSESHHFVDRKGKKTRRLEKNIIYTSTQLSSVNASKVLKTSNINVCKSSICELLKKMPSIVDNFSVKRVCVDDFALRKRFSYGTVMVDLDTHRIIDLIPSRDADDVRKWLKRFPHIEVISRDGAQIYAHAAQKAHPDVVQISDRFHLIKGLSEAVDKYIIRTFPAKLEIPAVTVQSPEIKQLLNINNRSKRIRFAHEQKEVGMTVYEIAVILHCTPKTVEKYLNTDLDTVADRTIAREKQHQLALQQKQKDVDEARELAKNGIPIEQIAKMLHHTYRTIQRYLDPGYSVVNGHYNVRIPNKLAPFEEKVIMLRSQGMTYPKIHEIISKDGYNGSVASLRMFMQKEQLRRINEQEVNSDYQPVEFVQRKALTQLIYKSIDQVFTISKDQYNQVLKSYPLIAELYGVIRDFYRIINSKREDRLEVNGRYLVPVQIWSKPV